MNLYSNTPGQMKYFSASDIAFSCHYAVHIAVFCDSLQMCSKELCLFRCDTVLFGRNLSVYVRNVLLHLQYSNPSMEELASSKCS